MLSARRLYRYDRWLLNMPLSEAFPALFSHCVAPDVTVARVVFGDLINLLRPRLTGAARAELDIVQGCLTPTILLVARTSATCPLGLPSYSTLGTSREQFRRAMSPTPMLTGSGRPSSRQRLNSSGGLSLMVGSTVGPTFTIATSAAGTKPPVRTALASLKRPNTSYFNVRWLHACGGF